MANLIDQAYQFINLKKYDEAIDNLVLSIKQDNQNWSAWHLLGHCYKCTNDLENSVACQEKAYFLNKKEPAILLALGIAHQLNQNFIEAIKAFEQAIRMDESYILGYNSLALTYKRMGNLDKSIQVYNDGFNALGKKFCLSLDNSRNNRIYKHENISFTIWNKSITYGAIYLAAKLNFDSVLIPNGKQVEQEEKTEDHQGLYWIEKEMNDGKKAFEIFPNLFNTFRESLRGNRLFLTMVRDQGLIFEMLGKEEDAKANFTEADYFE
jgi:tetratricopeptide (TPR) repeat protein